MKTKLKKLGFNQSEYNKNLYILWFDMFGVNVRIDKDKILSVEMVFCKSLYNFSKDVKFLVKNIKDLEELLDALKIVHKFFPKF